MDYNLSTAFGITHTSPPIYNSVALAHTPSPQLNRGHALAWLIGPLLSQSLSLPCSLAPVCGRTFQSAYTIAPLLNYLLNALNVTAPVYLAPQITYNQAAPLNANQTLTHTLPNPLALANNLLHNLGTALNLPLQTAWVLPELKGFSTLIRWGVFPILIDGLPVIIIPGPLPNPDWRPNQSGNTIIVPNRSLYTVTNSFSMVRLPERTPIECLGIGLSIDTASWGWSVSAEVDETAYDLLFPAPGQSVEIEILINGLYLFTAVVNKLPRKRTFGKHTFTLSASSRAVWLTEPFAAVSQRLNTSIITAQQLAAEALLAAPYSGDTGFSLDWRILDWLVPANAYSHTGSPMQYLSDIASAAGATIQAHRNAWSLSIQSLFPIPAWQWADAAPDYIIPMSAIEADSLEWDDLPDVNSIALSGGAVGGIINIARRAGTAGDKLLQPITHPLFTDIYATQQRATAALSQSGRRFKLGISMPILPETGIIDPNKLIRITEGANSSTWITRANNVSARFGQSMQNITLERYEYLV